MKTTVLLSEVFGKIYDGLCQNVGKKRNAFQLMTVPEYVQVFFLFAILKLDKKLLISSKIKFSRFDRWSK